MKKVILNCIKIFFTLIIYACIAVGIMYFVYNSGLYPQGTDTMYHVYRGDYVYHSILDGDYWPLLNKMWYNGVELMRYWPPIAAYTMAFCIFMAGGSAFHGYIIYIGLVFFLGAISWMIIGLSHKRYVLAVFIGALWFFMPNNLSAIFSEGNLPRALIMTILPLLIMFLEEYLINGKARSMCGIIITFTLIALCHTGFAGMIALTVLIYLLVYRIVVGTKHRGIDVIFGLLISFMITGLYLLPTLIGGMISGGQDRNTTAVMETFFQDLSKTINPFYRIDHGAAYFGLAALVLAIFGIIASKKKCIPGFVTAIIILLLTTTTAFSVLKLLPGGSYLWMLRFVSIGLCLILYSFYQWKTLKKSIVILVCILLTFDMIPSLNYIYGTMSTVQPEDRFAGVEDYTLLSEAKSMTTQRLAFMDAFSFESAGVFTITDFGEAVPAVYGAGVEAAVTESIVTQLNQALDDGNYVYLFDRLLMVGADTVVVKKEELYNKDMDEDEVTSAALLLGYTLKDSNDGYLLYHLDAANGNFGVVSKYDNIAIGTGASDIARMIPSAEEATNDYLDDFSFEELSSYKNVFLNGFKYHDVETAENLVTKLSEAGTRVIIFADGIPVDRRIRQQRFLGVTCSFIQFHNGFPMLKTNNGEVSLDLFPKDYSDWNTVYMNGLDNVLGSANEIDQEIDFYGTVQNDNIVFIAFNLTYFYSLTHDPTCLKLLSEMYGVSDEELAEHEIVPLDISYTPSSITINSDSDNVDTTLAFHDIYESDSSITNKGNLTYVNKGTTVINLSYPYFYQGLAVSIAGIVIAIIFLLMVKRGSRKNHI